MKKKTTLSPKVDKQHHNTHPLLRTALIVAIYLISFILLDFITKQFEGLPGIVAWYPPAGLTYTLLLVFGVRFTPAVIAALFFSSLFIYRMPQPPYLLFLWAFVISFIYAAAAWLLRHRIHFDWQLRKMRDVVWFVFTTVLVSALLAILSVSSSAAGSGIPGSEVLQSIFHWWIGEAVGVLTITPFVLIYIMPGLKRFLDGQPASSPAHRSFPLSPLSVLGQAASLLIILYWVFGAPLLDQYHPMYLIALPIIWIALQRGLKGISTAILALNFGVVFAVLLFRFDSARLGELELLMIVICIVGLLMGSVITERKQDTQDIASLAKYPFENPNPVLRLSQDGIVMHANPASAAVLDMWGCSIGGSAPRFWCDLAAQVLVSGENKTIDIEFNKKVYSMFVAPVTGSGYVNLYGRDITERKQAEEELQTAEEKYRTIFENAMEGIFQSTPEGRFLTVNPAFARMLGYESPEELIAKITDIGQQVYVESPRRAEFVRLMEEQGSVSEFEFQMQRKDGGIVWVSENTRAVRDANGIILYYEGKTEDITEHKQMEEKLEQERILLRTLIDSLPDRIYVMDIQGRKILSNIADWQASGGKRMEDVIGKTDLETYPPELAEKYMVITKSVIDSGKPIFNHGEPGLDSQGRQVWVLSSKVPLYNDRGNVTGLVGIGRDVTEHKQAEEKLNLFRALVDQSNDAIEVIDVKTGRFLDFNDTACRDLGYSREELLSLNVFDIDPTVNQSTFSQIGEELSRTGVMVVDGIHLRKDGTSFPVEVSLRYVQNEEKFLISVARNVTERKQAEEQIQRQIETMGALYELSRKLLEMDDFNLMLELVTRSAVEYVHVTFSCFLLLEQDDLVLRAGYPVRKLSKELQVNQREPLADHPLCQRVLDGKTPLLLQSQDPDAGEFVFILQNIAQNLCIVPLHFHEQPFGILLLGEARDAAREPFTAEKLRLAESIADQAASALHRALLGEQASHRLKRIASLREIDNTIAASFDLRLSLDVILKHVVEQLEVDAVAVLVVNTSLQRLVYKGGRGFRSDAIEHVDQRLDEGQAGQSIRECRMIHIPDVATSGVVFAQSEIMRAERFSVYIAIPLIVKGKANGVLEIYNRSPLDPDQEWFDFLNSLAGQTAIAIDNDQMFYGLQRSNIELSLAYDTTIEGWSHALDLRDKETEGHSLRVTELTIKMAQSFGMSNDKLKQIRWGALLHDIGKLGVPDGILLKPGPLTDEEWVVMKSHPTLAYEMLSPIQYLKEALDIPYCHHEKWDGTGYPRGLTGEQIPLAGRIFAVVDVWDALISDRPYRKAWPEEKALKHIQEQSGSHFDPEVVKVFLKELSHVQ